MLLIELTSPSTFIIRGEEARQWRIANRREIPGAKHIKRKRRMPKWWDGHKYPGRMSRGVLQLGRGMLENVCRSFPGSTIRPLFDTDRVPRPFFHGQDEPYTSQLYDYQWDGIEVGLKRKWGQIAMATNAGKGAMIALLAKAMLNAGGRTLILCDEISVFQALDTELTKWASIRPGHVSAGVDYPPEEPIVLAMVPTLHGRTFPLCPSKNEPWHRKSCDGCVEGRQLDREWHDWLGTFNMALLDEADKATADTWQRLMDGMTNTTWRLGFSGTFPEPDTLDGMVLEETIGPQLTRIKNIELVHRGISAKPQVELYPYHHAGIWTPPDWRKLEPFERRRLIFDQQVIYNEARHHFVASLIDPRVPNAIIVNIIDHGREMERAIPGSVFLHGSHSPAEREAVLARFRAGEFNVLIATKILDRGTNLLGHTAGLIFASGEGSTRQTLQRIGRGLRRTGGKEFVFIRDVIDSGHEYLANMSRQRVELYNEEGFEIRVIERRAHLLLEDL